MRNVCLDIERKIERKEFFAFFSSLPCDLNVFIGPHTPRIFQILNVLLIIVNMFIMNEEGKFESFSNSHIRSGVPA